MKAVFLTDDQINLLLEVVSSAQIEANFSSQKRHVLFLPDLFKTLSEYEKDLASLREVLTIASK